MGSLADEGELLLIQGKYKEALRFFDLALKTDPASSGLLSYKAEVLEEMSRFEDSLVFRNRAIMAHSKYLNPDLYYLYFCKGKTLLKNQQIEVALNCFELAFTEMERLAIQDGDMVNILAIFIEDLIKSQNSNDAMRLSKIILNAGGHLFEDVEQDVKKFLLSEESFKS